MVLLHTFQLISIHTDRPWCVCVYIQYIYQPIFLLAKISVTLYIEHLIVQSFYNSALTSSNIVS